MLWDDLGSNLFQKGFLLWIVFMFFEEGCTTLPTPQHEHYTFPKQNAFFGNVHRPYKKMGLARSKVGFVTLDPSYDEAQLCRNYFNKAVRDLVRIAKEKGGNAVIDVRSVVFLEDGHMESYPSAECSDDGIDGQVLVQGIVVKWAHQN